MECFVIIVNGWKPLTIITKRSILDVAAVLDPTLNLICLGVHSQKYSRFFLSWSKGADLYLGALFYKKSKEKKKNRAKYGRLFINRQVYNLKRD